MPASLLQLRDLCQDVALQMTDMSGDELRALLTMEDYHGFAKSRFPKEFLKEVAQHYNLEPSELQLEVVFVGRDLRDETHSHQKSSAVVLCLHEPQHFPSPRGARAYIAEKDLWVGINGGEVIEIPADTAHGFTVDEGGSLYFLSAQSPPIVRDDGHDDYVRVSVRDPASGSHTRDCPAYWNVRQVCTCGTSDL